MSTCVYLCLYLSTFVFPTPKYIMRCLPLSTCVFLCLPLIPHACQPHPSNFVSPRPTAACTMAYVCLTGLALYCCSLYVCLLRLSVTFFFAVMEPPRRTFVEAAYISLDHVYCLAWLTCRFDHRGLCWMHSLACRCSGPDDDVRIHIEFSVQCVCVIQ